MNTIENYKQLGYAVALQAAKDYKKASPKMRQRIIRELRGGYMDFITNGLSILLADALLQDLSICKRIEDLSKGGNLYE